MSAVRLKEKVGINDEKRLWFVLLLVLLLAGCGAAKNTVMPEQGMGEGDMIMTPLKAVWCPCGTYL